MQCEQLYLVVGRFFFLAIQQVAQYQLGYGIFDFAVAVFLSGVAVVIF